MIRIEVDLAPRIVMCPQGVLDGKRVEVVFEGECLDRREVDAWWLCVE